MIPPHPIGKITDYFARVEFQARGSPHLHIFLWITDAPNFESTENTHLLKEFIDRYISAKIPDDNSPQLKQLVTAFQIHAHTHTCQKGKYKSVTCRFDFPMPVSTNTRMKSETDTGSRCRFYILQRTENDIYVNPYNADVLINWKANMDIQIVGSMYAAAKYVCAYICKNEPFEFRQKISECMKSLPQNSSTRKSLSIVGNILLTHRTIGLQETAYRLLGLEMVFSSREAVFVDTTIPDKRYRLLKSKAQLQELPSNSTDIYLDNFIASYQYRPNDTIFTNMCLAEYVSKYRYTTYIPKQRTVTLHRYSSLANGKQKIIMRRSKEACIRFYIPELLANKEQYYFTLLYPFLPFSKETEIFHPYQTYETAFMYKKDKINEDQLKATNTQKRFELAVHLFTLNEEQLQDIYTITTPGYQQESDEYEQEEAKVQKGCLPHRCY